MRFNGRHGKREREKELRWLGEGEMGGNLMQFCGEGMDEVDGIGRSRVKLL
jgi:hypothetical protein